MSQQTRLEALVGAVGADVKDLRSRQALPRLYKTGSVLSARIAGANVYDLLLSDNYSSGVRRLSTGEVTRRLDAVANMGGNMVRTHAMISFGQVDSLMPTLGNYNEAAFVAMDRIMVEAAKRKLWLWCPMTDMWNYYHGGAITFARMVEGTTANTDSYYQNYFFTNAGCITAFKAYLTQVLTRVNSITGVRYVDDPTLAVIENGNEVYAATKAWTDSILSHLRTIAPNTLLADGANALQSRHPDGSNTAGYSSSGYSSLTVDADIVGGHFYNDRNGGYLHRDAAMAASANKAYVLGEFGWTDNQNGNTNVLRGGLSRSKFLAQVEADPNVSGSMFWSIVTDPINNVHDDGYQLFVPPLNTEQLQGMLDLTRHAWAMRHTKGRKWITPTDLTAYSDAFPGTTALDANKWINNTYGTGASVSAVSGVAAFVTGTAGSYSGVPGMTSKAPARLNRRLRFDFAPTDITQEVYFRTILRAQNATAADGSDGYTIEINKDGNYNVSVRVGGAQTVLGPADGGTSISGWANNVFQTLEFEVVGYTINVRIWLTSGTRPDVPSFSTTDQSFLKEGFFGIVLNNGASTTSTTWRVDNLVVSDYPDVDSDASQVYDRGMLLMKNGAVIAEPYSDANAPVSLMRTEGMDEPPTPPNGNSVEWTMDGASLWMKDDSGVKRMVGPTVETFVLSRSGALTVAAGTSQIPIVGGTFRILSIAARVSTAPTGAAVIVDVNKNGTTVFTTQANRPTVAVSGFNATVGAAQVTDLTTGDYLSVDVDQIGSTVAGSNLVVVVRMIRIA